MPTLTIAPSLVRARDRIVAVSGRELERPMVATADYGPIDGGPSGVPYQGLNGSAVAHVFYPETGGHKTVTVIRPKVHRYRDLANAARAYGKENGLTGAGGGYIAYADPDGQLTPDPERAYTIGRRFGTGRKAVLFRRETAEYVGRDVAYYGVVLRGQANVLQGWGRLGDYLLGTGAIRRSPDGRYEFESWDHS